MIKHRIVWPFFLAGSLWLVILVVAPKLGLLCYAAFWLLAGAILVSFSIIDWILKR